MTFPFGERISTVIGLTLLIYCVLLYADVVLFSSVTWYFKLSFKKIILIMFMVPQAQV